MSSQKTENNLSKASEALQPSELRYRHLAEDFNRIITELERSDRALKTEKAEIAEREQKLLRTQAATTKERSRLLDPARDGTELNGGEATLKQSESN